MFFIEIKKQKIKKLFFIQHYKEQIRILFSYTYTLTSQVATSKST